MTLRSSVLLPVLFIAGAPLTVSAGAADLPSFPNDVQPLLKSSCVDCHNGKKKKGGIDFSKFTDDASALAARKTWLKAIEQVKTGEMPPEGETPLTPVQKDLLLKWMQHAA